MGELEAKIRDIFSAEELTYDYWVRPNSEIIVTVDRGDWKHDHIYLDHVMYQHGFDCVANEQFGPPTYDDSYSSTHVFRKRSDG